MMEVEAEVPQENQTWLLYHVIDDRTDIPLTFFKKDFSP